MGRGEEKTISRCNEPVRPAGAGPAEPFRVSLLPGGAGAHNGVLPVAGVPLAARPRTPERFAGRRAELGEISARAAAAAAGRPQAVVVEGVPGIGKTSLLRRALVHLTGFRHLQADCAAGGAAGQLLAGAGRPATVASGGHRSGSLLAAVREMLAAGTPMAIALDDVQWMDADSAAELCATLAALRTAPLLTIAVARERWQPGLSGKSGGEWIRQQFPPATSLTRLRLAELSVMETASLLDGTGPAGSQELALRLHSYTGGHPALLSAVLDQGLALFHASPHDLLALSHPLVTGILRDIDSLPAASRDLLGVMAVTQERWPLATVATAARVDDPFAALEPLLDLGLVEWFPAEAVTPVSIRYPLYRDVVYRSLPAASRRVLHSRAASFALGARGWVHRVAAAQAAGLAPTLLQEAERYYLAGDNQRAGTLLTMSTASTSDPAERDRHIAAAAHWWLTLRAVDWGPGLDECLSGWPPSASRSLILGLLAEAAGRYSQAQALLAQAADLLPADGFAPLLKPDIELAMALVHFDLGNAHAQLRLANGVLGYQDIPPAHRAWAEYYAADAWGRLHGGPLAALGRLSAVVPDCAVDNPGDDVHVVPGSQSVRLWARGSWRVLSGRLRDGIGDLSRMLRAADRAAADPVRPLAYAYLSYAYYLLGQWRTAEQAAGLATAALTGHGVARLRVPVHAITACLDAGYGRHESAVRHLQSAVRWCADCGPDDYLAFPAIAEATVAQARGNYARMLSALQPLTGRPGLGAGYRMWWLPLEVEARTGAGQFGAAERALGRLRELAWAAGRRQGTTVAWLEARLAAAGKDPAVARTRFEEAVATPQADDDVALHRARLEHDFGKFLMSGRNRRAAIGRLRQAYTLYRTLGAQPFADRCAADLEACGAREPSATADCGGAMAPALSSRERKVAYLAVQGLTNQEIAGELFVSTKTVEYHLSNVFAKLGISSRRQLPASLGDAEPAA